MEGDRKGTRNEGGAQAGREPITVHIPSDLAGTLAEFCREKKVAPDRVVERALVEYFREGDMSH